MPTLLSGTHSFYILWSHPTNMALFIPSHQQWVWLQCGMYHTNMHQHIHIPHTHQRVNTKKDKELELPPSLCPPFFLHTCISAYLLSQSLPSLLALPCFVNFSTPVFLVADAYDMLGLGWNGPVFKKSQWAGEKKRESKRRKRWNLHVSRELKERNLKPPETIILPPSSLLSPSPSLLPSLSSLLPHLTFINFKCKSEHSPFRHF